MVIRSPDLWGCVNSGVAHLCGSSESPCVESYNFETGITVCLISGRQIDVIELDSELQGHDDYDDENGYTAASKNGINGDVVDLYEQLELTNEIEYYDQERIMYRQHGPGVLSLEEPRSDDENDGQHTHQKGIKSNNLKRLSEQNDHDDGDDNYSEKSQIRKDRRLKLESTVSLLDGNDDEESVSTESSREGENDLNNEDESFLIFPAKKSEITSSNDGILGLDFGFLQEIVLYLDRTKSMYEPAAQIPEHTTIPNQPIPSLSLVASSAFRRTGIDMDLHQQDIQGFKHYIRKWWSRDAIQTLLPITDNKQNERLIAELLMAADAEWATWNDATTKKLSTAVCLTMEDLKHRFRAPEVKRLFSSSSSAQQQQGYVDKREILDPSLLHLFMFVFRMLVPSKDFIYFWTTSKLLEYAFTKQEHNQPTDSKAKRIPLDENLLLQSLVTAMYSVFIDGWIYSFNISLPVSKGKVVIRNKLIPSLKTEYGFPEFSVQNKKRKRSEETNRTKSFRKWLQDHRLEHARKFVETMLKTLLSTTATTTTQFVYGVNQAILCHVVCSINCSNV